MKGFSLNRRRVVSSFLMLLMSLMLFASYAMGADDLAAIANRGNDNTIDSVLENSEVVATSEAATTNENTSNSVSSSTNRAEGTQELMKAFSNTNMLEKNNLDNEFTQSASNIVSKAVQHLIFLISLGVIVLIVFDVAFIIFAPLRPFLCPNMAQGGMPAGGAGGMGGSPGMGMGGMGGMGGYGSRMGMGGYGSRMGMGMGSRMGMGRAQGMNPMAGRGASQYVSDAATQAVMMAQQGAGSALIIYAKNMAVTVVIALAICILAATGVLNTLGMAIGLKVSEFIAGLSAGMI